MFDYQLFVNCFTMTFIAEWGDRSQLATIVLAGLNDVWGVILGGCAGHAVCTGGAVLVGTIIAKFISPRKITFIGALVFIGFAIASIFTDPNEDGIDGIPKIEVMLRQNVVFIHIQTCRAMITAQGS